MSTSNRLRVETLFSVTAGLALFAQTVAGAELLSNGNLESFTFNSPNSWSFSDSLGASGPSGVVSPFTGIYPSGSTSLALYDGPSVDLDPSLSQNFTPQTGMIGFAVDFRFEALSGSPWFYVLSGNHATAGLSTAFLFWIDNNSHELVADGLSGPSASLLTLTTGLWYHIEGTADVGTHTFAGSVTPFGSAAVPFSSLAFNSSLIDLRQVAFDDSFSAGNGGTYRNGDIYLDNFSITAAPEPSVAGLLLGYLILKAYNAFSRRRA